jgi:hypothetical protein
MKRLSLVLIVTVWACVIPDGSVVGKERATGIFASGMLGRSSAPLDCHRDRHLWAVWQV